MQGHEGLRLFIGTFLPPPLTPSPPLPPLLPPSLPQTVMNYKAHQVQQVGF